MGESSHHRGEEFISNIFDKWRSRYITNGLYYGDVIRLEQQIDSWAEWCEHFSEIGQEHETLGREAADAGNYESAAQHLVHAAKYYHFGSHVWHVDETERERAHRNAVDVHLSGGQYLDPPITRIEAPCDVPGADSFPIAGNLRVPDKDSRDSGDPAPLVLLFPGLDSTKEEMSMYEPYLLDRGMATLSIDGPGQGETWYHQRMTPRYAEMIAEVVDYVQSQSYDGVGVDTSRLGALGQSLGGFYAPYVAAHDDRFDAVVGFSGPFSVGPVSHWGFEVAVDQFRYVCKTDSMVEIDEITEEMSLRDDIQNLEAPSLMITGARDTIVPAAQTERIAKRAPNGEFLVFEDGNHNCQNVHYKCRPRAADWLDRNL